MTSIGWVSASPIARTGYGRETKGIGFRIVDAGQDVTFIGTFGDVIIWGGVDEAHTAKGKKVTILSLTNPASAAAVINEYAKQYDLEMIVGFMDCFGLEFLNDVNLPVIGYIPIDGPFTAEMHNFMRNYHKIIAFSEFGYRELQKWYPPSRIGFIAHAVDTETFRPLSSEEYDAAREWYLANHRIPKDAFLAIDMGANIGPRKLLPLLMTTFSKFVKRHPDAHLFIQTNAYSPNRGYNLVSHRINLKMENNIHFSTLDPIIFPVEDDFLRTIFGGAQVFLHNACAEGRGLPQLEAMACGTPPVAPRNSAQTEQTEGLGWVFESVDPDEYFEFPVYVPTLQQYPVPSQSSLLEKLEEAYQNPDQVVENGRKSREYVEKNCAYDILIPKWLKLFEEVRRDTDVLTVLNKALKK